MRREHLPGPGVLLQTARDAYGIPNWMIPNLLHCSGLAFDESTETCHALQYDETTQHFII